MESDDSTALRGPFERTSSADPDAVVDALTDPHARRVLAAAREPVTADDAVAACDLGRSTVYRKLDALVGAGLLEVQTEIRGDGYHRNRYRTALDAATLRITDDQSLDVSVRRRDDSTDTGRARTDHGSVSVD